MLKRGGNFVFGVRIALVLGTILLSAAARRRRPRTFRAFATSRCFRPSTTASRSRYLPSHPSSTSPVCAANDSA